MPNKTDMPYSTPEAEGVSSGSILRFIDSLKKKELQVHSLVLLKNSRIICEAWWKPYAREYRHEMYSLSKSFTSTAAGILHDESMLNVDEKVSRFFPEFTHLHNSGKWNELKIRHLLTMSTGHALDTAQKFAGQADWAKAFFETPLEHIPGTYFKYNSGATYILALIIQRITGQSLTGFLEKRLFAPLGIKDITWDKCPKGFEIGGAGLNARTTDIAKLGLLYLNKGVWNGRRILSEKWAGEATSRQIPNGSKKTSDWEQGYGFQFWRCRHNCYRGDGAFGQFCIVFPEKNAVLAMTGGLKDMQGVLRLAWKHILPAMKPGPVRARKETCRALKSRLTALDYIPLKGLSLHHGVPLFSGKEFKLEKNALGIESVSFQFAGDTCIYTEKTKAGVSRIECGAGKWINGSTSFFCSYMGISSFRTAACCSLINDKRIEITLFLYETPYCRKMTFDFTGERIEIRAELNVSWTDKQDYRLEGRGVQESR